MPLLPLEKLNADARLLFNEWYFDAMKPNLEMVSQRIGVGYQTLKHFKTGTSDVKYNNIIKILTYLEKQGFTLENDKVR